MGDIAAAFKNIGLAGYTGSSTGGIVTFTADAAGYKPEPTVSGVLTGKFTNGSSSSLEYDFTGKTGADLLGKTVMIGNTTYEFATSDKLINGLTKNGNVGIVIGDGSVDPSNITADQITTAFSDKIGSISGYSKSVSGDKVVLIDNGAANYSVTTGQNAELMMSFDGNPDNAILISRTENKFTLDDVNFELLKADPTVTKDNPITFTVKNETDDLYKKVSDFVDDYNALLKVINDKVNETTKTDGETFAPLTDDQKATMTPDQIAKWEANAKKGILQSDSLLTSISYDLRNSMSDMVDSVKSALYSVGIKETNYDQYGKLTIDETTFKNALTNNPDLVTSIFTGNDGIASRLQNVITKNTNVSIGADGLLVQKAGISSRAYDNSTIGEQINDYNTKIKELKTQLETEQDRYYKKFTALESYISVMNSQSSLFFNNTSSS
jgi:flagellar hook-associated protein 2